MISLTCKNCSTDAGKSGIPATFNTLQLTGSDLSPDPSVFAYGPGLQMEVLTSCTGTVNRYKCCAMGITQPKIPTETCSTQSVDPATKPADPAAALEPGATYTVVLNPALAGRNSADKILIDDKAKALLTFTTEPFKALNIAGGNADGPTDVDSSTDNGDGSVPLSRTWPVRLHRMSRLI